MRSILANKDAEAARLRAEIARLRHAFSKADGLHESQATEVQELQAQLRQAQQASRWALILGEGEWRGGGQTCVHVRVCVDVCPHA